MNSFRLFWQGKNVAYKDNYIYALNRNFIINHPSPCVSHICNFFGNIKSTLPPDVVVFSVSLTPFANCKKVEVGGYPGGWSGGRWYVNGKMGYMEDVDFFHYIMNILYHREWPEMNKVIFFCRVEIDNFLITDNIKGL